MTALTEWFCNFCNASAQRRDDGDELSHGYERTLDFQAPEGWWEVPGMGPGHTGHACPHCIENNPDVRAELIHRRSAGLENLTGDSDTGWPARTSPFGTQGG